MDFPIRHMDLMTGKLANGRMPFEPGTMQSEPLSVAIPQAMQIGLEHHQAGRLPEAERIYRQVLRLDPHNLDALHLLGIIAHQVGKNEIAVELIAKALTIKPDFAGALSNHGNALQELKRYDEALASYDKALSIDPDSAEVLCNRGNVMQYLNRFDEALTSYDKALSIKPDYPQAISNRANILRKLQRHDEALAGYDKALSIEPDCAEVHFKRSMFRLRIGDFERGWEEYEWRWKQKDLNFPNRNFSQPLWLGKEDIAGKIILLHAEQGLGDTIQFARYAQAVAEKGAKVILEVAPSLRSLLSEIPGAYKVLSQGDPLPEFNCHCPLLSLPLAFNTRMETIPAKVPYLKAGAAAVKKWKEKLGQCGGPRIAIVWSGSRAHKNDSNRSIALSELTAIAGDGIALVSLQNEAHAEEEKVLAASERILHFGSELKDFSDTAALASLMDLVISVDTSVAHLAGALGKPVWILLPFSPDWRWLEDREDSPWYPTARLFRQSRIGDWSSVIESVQKQLRKCVSEGNYAKAAPLSDR